MSAHSRKHPRYAYLDTPIEEQIAHDQGLWIYCVCGHHQLLKPTHTLARNRTLTTHQLMRRMRCTKCNALGNIPRINVTPMSTFQASGYKHPALRSDW